MGSREQGGREVGVSVPLALLMRNEGGEGMAEGEPRGGTGWPSLYQRKGETHTGHG